MSIYDRLYIARLAPAAATDIEAIRRGASVVQDGETVLESFAPDAFLSSREPQPVFLAHDEKRQAGWLVNRTVHGGWHIGTIKLDASRAMSAVAADALKIGAPVSIGFRSLRRDPNLIDGVTRHTLVVLDEVSVLRVGEHPMIQGACITSIIEPAKETSSRREPQPGAVIVGDGQTARRYFETALTLR